MKNIKLSQDSNDENEVNLNINMYKMLKEREAALTKANGLVVFE